MYAPNNASPISVAFRLKSINPKNRRERLVALEKQKKYASSQTK